MIRYSFLFLNHATFFRFENWLALEFHILCEVEDLLNAEITEGAITGIFAVPAEIHDEFLKRWEEIKDEFRMDLWRRQG